LLCFSILTTTHYRGIRFAKLLLSHLGVVVGVEFPDELQYLGSEARRVVGPALRRAEVAHVLALPPAVHAAPLVRVLCEHTNTVLLFYLAAIIFLMGANSPKFNGRKRRDIAVSLGGGLKGYAF
jgi:hypothetical protein